MKPQLFDFEEHQRLEGADKIETFKNILNAGHVLRTAVTSYKSIKDVDFLGIFNDGGVPKAHYYIGASWFVRNEYAFVVKPKVEVDYIKLFMTALELNSENEAAYFSNYYYIDFEKPAIETNALDNVITPLLILHYISLLRHLVSRGLKKGYVVREENLRSKIRGRILLQRHLTKNVFAKREDRVFCRFQEFTEDIPENRILKKALSFSVRFINQLPGFKSHLQELTPHLSMIGSAFENVSEEVTIAQVAKVNAGKIFRHYESAIKVAKLILRHFDYSIDNTSETTQSVRPFCIDMPRLYEMYVLSLLRKAYGDQIQFQVKGSHKTQVDYIDVNEQIILDAKYKPRYKKGDIGITEDVREISGYARDKRILKVLKWNANIADKKGKFLPDCVIVYPVVQVEENDNGELSGVVAENACSCKYEFDKNASIVSQCDEIKAFEGFYKIAIPLPKKANEPLAN